MDKSEGLEGNFLSSWIQYDNHFLYQKGNPLLRPTKWLSWDFDVIYSWLQLNVGYVNYKHSIFNVDEYYDDKQTVLIQTSKNVEKMRSMFVMFTASPHFGFWNPSYSVWMTKAFFNSQLINVNHNLEHPRFYCQFNNSFKLPNNFILGLNYTIYGQGNDANIYLKTQHECDLTLYKGFFKDKLAINFYAYDIFKTSKLRFTWYSQHTTYYKDDYNYSQKLRLSITFKFNSVRSKYKGTGAGNDEKARL